MTIGVSALIYLTKHNNSNMLFHSDILRQGSTFPIDRTHAVASKALLLLYNIENHDKAAVFFTPCARASL